MSVEARRAFPKTPAHKATAEYFRSKATRNALKHTFDLDDPKLAKVRAQRADQEAQDRLLKALAKRKRAKDHRDGWVELEQIGSTLRSNMLEFQVFIQENREKRMRKEAEVAHFQNMQLDYEDKVESLKSKTEFLKSVKSKMEERIASHGFYEDFIEAAARAGVEYTSVNDIVVRYDVLLDSRRAIYENQMVLRGRFYQSFLAINAAMSEMAATQLGLRNEVGKLMNRYETARAKSLVWENVLSAVKDEMHRRWGEAEMVKTSCRNIYLDICARRNLKPVAKDDFKAQLKRVKDDLRSMRMALEKN